MFYELALSHMRRTLTILIRLQCGIKSISGLFDNVVEMTNKNKSTEVELGDTTQGVEYAHSIDNYS